MGAEVEVTTDGGKLAVEAALTVVATLDARWSRFRADSELSQLNSADGPALARPSTARIIEVALAGSRLTRGWFDPTRGAEIRAAGYRTTQSDGWGPAHTPPNRNVTVDTDPGTGLVTIPAGAEIDLGGIAKGWTADLAAELLSQSRATYAGVSIGGDVRVISQTRALLEIAAPGGDLPPAVVGLKNGGVAVSGPTRRRSHDGRHHLIDPFTQRPASAPRVAAVIAASAAGAEMIATAAAIAPLDDAVEIIDTLGATAWLVEADGSLTTVGTPQRYLLDPGWLATPNDREWMLREWKA